MLVQRPLFIRFASLQLDNLTSTILRRSYSDTPAKPKDDKADQRTTLERFDGQIPLGGSSFCLVSSFLAMGLVRVFFLTCVI